MWPTGLQYTGGGGGTAQLSTEIENTSLDILTRAVSQRCAKIYFTLNLEVLDVDCFAKLCQKSPEAADAVLICWQDRT